MENNIDYKNLVELEKKNKILIGVGRIMARKFYTDIPIKKIEKETDEAPYFEKMIILPVFLLGPVLFLISIILGFLVFGFWGIIFFALSLFIYITYSSLSVKGNSKITGITILLIALIVSYFFKIFNISRIIGAITVFVLSLWCIRFLYCASTFFLRNFIIRNEKAYNYLSQYLKIKLIENNSYESNNSE